jgi:hypothetical protein
MSYTWSQSINHNMGNSGGNLFLGNNAPSSLFNGDYKNNHGDSGLDQRQRLVINWIWSPTLTRRTDLVSRVLINNWQLATITTLATGQPVTESLSVSSPLTAAQVSSLGLPSNLVFTSTFSFLGVTTLRLPDIHRVDARISK